MKLNQALQNIRKYNGTFAKDEILCIREHKDEAIPHLLEFLATAIQNHKKAEDWDDDLDYPSYAMHLLAEFGVHEAFPLFIEILELDEERCDWMLGDTLTEGMSALIASVAKVSEAETSDIDRIKSVAENTGLDLFQRTAAVNTCIVLYINGMYSRSNLIAYLGHLLETYTEDAKFTSCLASYCCNVAAKELYERIRELFEKGRMERSIIGPKHFAEDIPEEPEEKLLVDLKGRSYYCLITDTIEAMETWACFVKNKRVPQSSLVDYLEYPGQAHNVPIVKSPKVGRNDPCPCGSGQKYKRCCLGKTLKGAKQ